MLFLLIHRETTISQAYRFLFFDIWLGHVVFQALADVPGQFCCCFFMCWSFQHNLICKPCKSALNIHRSDDLHHLFDLNTKCVSLGQKMRELFNMNASGGNNTSVILLQKEWYSFVAMALCKHATRWDNQVYVHKSSGLKHIKCTFCYYIFSNHSIFNTYNSLIICYYMSGKKNLQTHVPHL